MTLLKHGKEFFIQGSQAITTNSRTTASGLTSKHNKEKWVFAAKEPVGGAVSEWKITKNTRAKGDSG